MILIIKKKKKGNFGFGEIFQEFYTYDLYKRVYSFTGHLEFVLLSFSIARSDSVPLGTERSQVFGHCPSVSERRLVSIFYEFPKIS